MPKPNPQAIIEKPPELTPEQIRAKIALTGNLADLTQEQQWEYYQQYCAYLGLDPITKPFDLITTRNEDGTLRTVLYANASCSTQIANNRDIRYSKPECEYDQVLGVYTVTVQAFFDGGRSCWRKGVAHVAGMKGKYLENAIKKAETQAHRRATLALCGVAMPDESELEDIPGATVTRLQPPTLDVDKLHPAFDDPTRIAYITIGEMIRESHDPGLFDTDGERLFILAGLQQGAFQAVAQKLNRRPDEIFRVFGYLHNPPNEIKAMPVAEANEPHTEESGEAPAHEIEPASPDFGNAISNRAAEKITQAQAAIAAEQARASDPVPLANTAQGLRAACIDLGNAIFQKYGKTKERNYMGIDRVNIMARISTLLGQDIKRFADIPESLMQDVYDDLENYDRELHEKADAI